MVAWIAIILVLSPVKMMNSLHRFQKAKRGVTIKVKSSALSNARIEKALRYLKRLGRVLLLLAEAATLLEISFAVNAFKNAQKSGAIDQKSWTIGQIVAIFVWAPPVCKYLYWTLCEPSVQALLFAL